MIRIHDAEQGSQEWKELRAGKFTGSNAYKLLGSFGATEYAKAIESNFTGNYWTKRGHILEDEACELYEAITKTKVEHCGFVTNDKYPHCLYSPDGLPPVALLEIKCFDEPHHLELINGDIPLKVMAQIQFGLLITERPCAHLVPYNPDFAKKEITTDTGRIPNPNYDPKKAFKIITVKANRAAHTNFKKILSKEAAKV